MSNKRSQKQTQVSSNQNRAKAANHHLIYGIICPKWSSSKLEEMVKERKEGGGSEISLRCEGSVWLDLDTSAQPSTTIITTMHNHKNNHAQHIHGWILIQPLHCPICYCASVYFLPSSPNKLSQISSLWHHHPTFVAEKKEVSKFTSISNRSKDSE